MKKIDFISSSDIQVFSVFSVDFVRQFFNFFLLRVHGDIVSKSGSSIYKLLLSRSRFLTELFLKFQTKTFCQGGQNCILGIKRYMFLEKIRLRKNLIFFKFGHSKFFCYFGGFFSAGFQNLHSTCPPEDSKAKVFLFWQYYFSRSRILTELFLKFQTKTFCHFGQNCIRSIQKNNLLKIQCFEKIRNVPPLSDMQWKVLWLLGEKLRNFRQICLRPSQLHFEEIFFPKLEYFFIVFLYLNEFVL